jgi:hypothetical protein
MRKVYLLKKQLFEIIYRIGSGTIKAMAVGGAILIGLYSWSINSYPLPVDSCQGWEYYNALLLLCQLSWNLLLLLCFISILLVTNRQPSRRWFAVDWLRHFYCSIRDRVDRFQTTKGTSATLAISFFRLHFLPYTIHWSSVIPILYLKHSKLSAKSCREERKLNMNV